MNNMDCAKLNETIADIAYIAGYRQHYSGNSRTDIAIYISWAREFESIHQYTDWDEDDYMLKVEEFTNYKLAGNLTLKSPN